MTQNSIYITTIKVPIEGRGEISIEVHQDTKTSCVFAIESDYLNKSAGIITSPFQYPSINSDNIQCTHEVHSQ